MVMRIRERELVDHLDRVTDALRTVCGLARSIRVFGYPKNEAEINVGIVAPLSDNVVQVTSDNGLIERVLGLPIPSSRDRRYWIGMHETWRRVGRHQIEFGNCGLRVYTGRRAEDLVQFLRLEWVAPRIESDGSVHFQGGHAAHPHWHIDTSALAGEAEYLAFLERVTTPEMGEVEEFGPTTKTRIQRRSERGFEWLKKVHFPAHAGWMMELWPDVNLRGPHQNVLSELESLSNWWVGAIHYIAQEIKKHGWS